MTDGKPPPAVAVVIPSLEGDVGSLLASLQVQTLQPAEVEVVRGARPSGLARNIGAARTTAPILVFVDDDAVLPRPDTLARLVAPLLDDAAVAVAGTGKLVPSSSSPFQRAVARQVPRVEHPVVDRLTESNPPLDRHGYTQLTTTCCAMWRRVLDACGGFDEELVRGADTDFFRRSHGAGHRLFLAPGTWVEHPAPGTLTGLLAKHFWYGVGYAQEVHRDPVRGRGRLLRTPASGAAYLLVRTLLLAPHVLVPYTVAGPSWRPGFKPLKALASYAAAVGYVYGWYRHPLPRARPRSTPGSPPPSSPR